MAIYFGIVIVKGPRIGTALARETFKVQSWPIVTLFHTSLFLVPVLSSYVHSFGFFELAFLLASLALREEE